MHRSGYRDHSERLAPVRRAASARRSPPRTAWGGPDLTGRRWSIPSHQPARRRAYHEAGLTVSRRTRGSGARRQATVSGAHAMSGRSVPGAIPACWSCVPSQIHRGAVGAVPQAGAAMTSHVSGSSGSQGVARLRAAFERSGRPMLIADDQRRWVTGNAAACSAAGHRSGGDPVVHDGRRHASERAEQAR